jgi:hypothetical protein
MNCNKKYKIHTAGAPWEIERVLTALFKIGYVFNSTYRFRKFAEINSRWNVEGWNWIMIGSRSECRAVLDGSFYRDDNYETISLEDFLKLK